MVSISCGKDTVALTLQTTFGMFYLVNTSNWDWLNIQPYFPASLLDSLLQNGMVVTAVS